MNFAIAAGHRETAQAAQEIMLMGGNAADAAVAAFIATWVVEPCMASAGGGAFAQVYSAESGRSWILDGFCQAPGRKVPLDQADFFPVEVDFGDTIEVFHVGRGATAVPGAIALAFTMNERFGSMPMTELVQPAIQLAKHGVVIDRFQRENFSLLEPILRLNPRARPLFFPGGRLIGEGELFRMPQLADFLDYLSREGQAAFYRGEVARKIGADYEAGGQLRQEGLENYRVEIREPLAFPFRRSFLYTNPEPGIGGIVLAHLLNQFPREEPPPPALSKAYILQWLSFQRLSWKLKKQPPALKAALAAQLASRMGSTTQISIVGPAGNAISLTATNGEGSGYFVENTDIQLNNILGEAALLPGGFNSWKTDTRLSSMMAPTILLDKERRLQAVLGSSGAGRIASAISQVANLLASHRLPVREAVEAPRIHLDDSGLNLEPGFDSPPGEKEARAPVRLWQNPSLFFGGVHAVARRQNTWEAAGDPRRDGVAFVR